MGIKKNKRDCYFENPKQTLIDSAQYFVENHFADTTIG